MKTREFIISDTNFGHGKSIELFNRPFSTKYEMDSQMIKNWNKTVSNNDIVYINGDLALDSKSSILRLLKRLNGKKILIMGNHEFRVATSQWFINTKEFLYVSPCPIIIRQNIIISHQPIRDTNKSFNKSSGFINLYGHVHNDRNYVNDNCSACTCADRINFTPILIDDLIKNIK